MKIKATGLLMLCTFLVGCGSGDAPFGEVLPGEEVVEEDEVVVEEDVIDSDRQLPPGTSAPEPDDSIFRSEPEGDDSNSGDGFAQGVSYDSASDTFTVDNLPFDGAAETPYIRGTAVSALGPYAVYEAVAQHPDPLNNVQVNQFTHRAVYGVSSSGETEFAIVRTGAYIEYGFGGFVYERNGSVSLPTSGQAIYSGTGAGIRDFDGAGGLQYITADVEVAVDFDDFNSAPGLDAGAVRGRVGNKRVFDIDGTDVTLETVARINTLNESSLSAIPTTTFTIQPGVLDENGEMTGTVISPFVNSAGEAVEYAEGEYYGILSGENADELVGVVVTRSSADIENVGVRDTIGFQIFR